jgi:flagellar motor switch protein FliG
LPSKKAAIAKQATSGREKAATLLIALGPEFSSDIFRHLKEEEIEELTLEIASIKSVTSEEKEQILEEFYQICLAQNYIAEGGISYAREILEKALGTQKALDIINKLTASLQVRPFEFVRKSDPAQLLNFIQKEHPQTIALILAYLSSQQASQVLSGLPQEKQVDVARRIATMDRTSPDVIKEVENILIKNLSSLVTEDFTSAGGIQAIVDILNSVDRSTERHIIETLDLEDTELAEEIKKRMFVFEDILLLDGRSVQRFLRDVENSVLSVALKGGASEEVSKLIFANMSKRLAEMIKEDIEFMGPVRLKDVEEAQQKIVNTIRRLEDAGEIIISRGGGDEVIV